MCTLIWWSQRGARPQRCVSFPLCLCSRPNAFTDRSINEINLLLFIEIYVSAVYPECVRHIVAYHIYLYQKNVLWCRSRKYKLSHKDSASAFVRTDALEWYLYIWCSCALKPCGTSTITHAVLLMVSLLPLPYSVMALINHRQTNKLSTI